MMAFAAAADIITTLAASAQLPRYLASTSPSSQPRLSRCLRGQRWSLVSHTEAELRFRGRGAGTCANYLTPRVCVCPRPLVSLDIPLTCTHRTRKPYRVKHDRVSCSLCVCVCVCQYLFDLRQSCIVALVLKVIQQSKWTLFPLWHTCKDGSFCIQAVQVVS